MAGSYRWTIRRSSGVRSSRDFSAIIACQFLFENDVNAAAVGFAQQHPPAKLETIAYLYFPQKYPPGAGLLIEGKLFRGKAHYSGEVSCLPLGIDWIDPELYRSVENSTLAVARVIASLSAVLNPHRVVLQAEFLSDRHLADIRAYCARQLPEAARPELAISTSFTDDLQAGIVSLTLGQLPANEFATSS